MADIDDREALVETFLNATKGRQVWSPMHEAEIFADAILAAGFSRATVPDAEVAAKAWDEGALAQEYWITNPNYEVEENPYRKVVES